MLITALTVISLEINFFHMLTPEVIEVFFLFIILLIVHLFHSGSLGLKPTLQIFSFFISILWTRHGCTKRSRRDDIRYKKMMKKPKKELVRGWKGRNKYQNQTKDIKNQKRPR